MIRAVRLTGTLMGLRLIDLFAPESVAYVEPFYRRGFDGESVRFDLPVFARVYSISAGPLTIEDGRVTTIVAVAP